MSRPEDIVERYSARLLAEIRKCLKSKIRQRVDEEDVFQSAYKSFFLGDFDVPNENAVFAVLRRIVVNKAISKAREHTRDKRSVDREISLEEAESLESLEADGRVMRRPEGIRRRYERPQEVAGDIEPDSFFSDREIELITYGATPDQAALAVELVETLPDDLQALALMRMANMSDKNIADAMGWSPEDVQRSVKRIVLIWKDENLIV